MASTDPVPWAPLAELGAHTCLQCESVFENRRDDLHLSGDRETAVARLYEWWHDAYGDEVGTEQGGAYVFAYLLERDGLFEPFEERRGGESADWPAVRGDVPVSLVARRPDDATLERWVWEEEQVFWWIAVQCGVHYSLVQYWLYEADIPVMRRNVPDRLLDQVDERRE